MICGHKFDPESVRESLPLGLENVVVNELDLQEAQLASEVYSLRILESVAISLLVAWPVSYAIL